MASKYFQFCWLSAANNWTQNTLWSSQAVSFKWTGIYCKIMVHGTFFCYLALFCSWFMSMNKWHSAMLTSAFIFFIHILKTNSAVVLMWVLQVPTCSVNLFFLYFFFMLGINFAIILTYNNYPNIIIKNKLYYIVLIYYYLITFNIF